MNLLSHSWFAIEYKAALLFSFLRTLTLPWGEDVYRFGLNSPICKALSGISYFFSGFGSFFYLSPFKHFLTSQETPINSPY